VGSSSIASPTATADYANDFSQLFQALTTNTGTRADNVYLHEVIIYSSALSTTDVAAIQSNIITKFY
jgi:hypothetical protein